VQHQRAARIILYGSILRVSDTTGRETSGARLEKCERKLDEGAQVPATRDPDVVCVPHFRCGTSAAIDGRSAVRLGHHRCA
jgi:hypothetical protein